MTTFPAIRLRTSPTPIGRRPGVLFDGINLQAKKASNDVEYPDVGVIFSIHSFFITFAKIFLRSEVAVPYCDEVRILHHPSTSIPDDPDPHFVAIA